jgi:hypothetical protein
MVATTAPTADANVLLVELAIGLGYNFADHSRAACRPEAAFDYCRRCDVVGECLVSPSRPRSGR